jgi:signal transduction histidine kinase
MPYPIKVNVYLTSASALYARQSARTFWFGSLIAVSALAALIGLGTAWRTFHRQQLLNEMKSNFVSSVSHELRAPIASVRLMAESLERGKVQDAYKQGDYFRFIGQECRRLSALIENVLDFARIEQRRKEYEFEPTDMIALVRQTVALMETYAEEKQIALALSLPETPVSALCDGRALQQALVNLIDNAIKHSPRDGTVTVSLECTESRTGVPPVPLHDSPRVAEVAVEGAGGTPVLLWVEDHGDGIPPEEQGKIFERFYRRGSELRRETQGVGIGLSIVKHIVEAHCGNVVVRSVVGQGSRFTIELPLRKYEV